MEMQNSQIDNLVSLQKIDSEKHKYIGKCNEIPKKIETMKNNLKKATESISTGRQKLKEFELEHRGRESKLLSVEDNLKKLSSRLFEVKTNKEYTALLHEIDAMKNEKSASEDSIIGILDSIENQKAEIKRLEDEYKNKETAANDEIGKLENQMKDYQDKINELELRRNEIIVNIDKDVLSNYEKVLKNKNFLAVVKVEKEICCGCNINVPPQIVNEIRKKKEIISCQHCSRILYWEE